MSGCPRSGLDLRVTRQRIRDRWIRAGSPEDQSPWPATELTNRFCQAAFAPESPIR